VSFHPPARFFSEAKLLSRTITFRPSTPADLDGILPLVRRDAACPLTAERYLSYLDDGQYSHGRTWIAADGAGDIRAVAVWWAGPEGAEPRALDAVYVHESVGVGEERVALAAELLGAGQRAFAEAFGQTQPPEFHVFIPSDWRDRPEVMGALTWRRAAAERAGLWTLLERLRFEWTPQDGLVDPIRGLEFRPEPDDEVFVDLFARVLSGSLDTTSTRQAAQLGAVEQARQDLVHLRDLMLGERSWWRVAVNADGDVVGRADTDLVNKPMAEAFLRVGYRNHARRLVFSAS